MKILIITFSKGQNPGTFMQAYGVMMAFNKTFPDAHIEFLDFPNFKKTLKTRTEVKYSLFSIFLQKGFTVFRRIRYKLLHKKVFNLTNYSVDLFDYNESRIKALFAEYNLISIGSDTILEKVSENNKIGLNWGPSFIEQKKMFFSASAAPANFTLNETEKQSLKEAIDSFFFNGLRDELTLKLFEKRIGIENIKLIKQPDPTYFIDVNSFKLPIYYKFILPKKKIAIFNFNHYFPYRKKLAEFVRKEGYALVSTAMYNNHADISFSFINAFEWAAVFKYANLVITERFHDSLFSLRNKIPVFAIDWDQTRFSSENDSKTFRLFEDYNIKECHFNIKTEEELGLIITGIKNVSTLFNMSKIEEKNKEFIELANQLTKKIKYDGKY